MAKYSLNIYGENDEILKTYETDVIRWKLLMDAVKIHETIGDKNAAEQIGVISGFIKSVFPGITDDEIEMAAAEDIMNTFKAIVIQTGSINGGHGGEQSPNAKAAQKK